MDHLGKEYSTDASSCKTASKQQEHEEIEAEESKKDSEFANLCQEENANIMTASVAYLKLINVPTMFDIGCP